MMAKKKKPKLDEKIEQSLKELDAVFGSRRDTVKVLLGEYLRGCLPGEVEGHELAKANTLSKLCDMWLAHRKALKKQKRENKVRPTKISGEVMKHITGLGLLRSDLYEDITNDEALTITPWDAKWLIIARWAFEGNLSELAPVARDVITKYGGGESELAFLDTYIDKATSDPDWTFWATEHIYRFLVFAQLYVGKQPKLFNAGKHPEDGIKDLCKGRGTRVIEAEIANELQLEELQGAERTFQQLKEVQGKIQEFRNRQKARGRLDTSELYLLEQLKGDELYLLEQQRECERGMDVARKLEGMD